MSSLGEKVRKERKRQKISLKVLAEKVDVSASFLSQMENNKNAPSLTTLKKISDCLNVTVSYLLEEGENVYQKLIKSTNRHKLENIWEGTGIEFLSAFDPRNVMEACIHTVGGKVETKEAPYHHEGQEFIFVLEGTIVLSISGESILMEKGDSYYICDCENNHYFYSLSEKSAKVLCVTNPPYFYLNKNI